MPEGFQSPSALGWKAKSYTQTHSCTRVCTPGFPVSSGHPGLLGAAGGGLTISRYSGVHRGFLSLSFCGCFQLLFQPADITVCLGLHDAQLRVDVFVLVAGVFLILAREQEQPHGARQTAGAQGFVDALKRSLANADGRRAGSRRQARPGQLTPLELLPTGNGDRQRAESQGPAHSAARACSPSATGLLVAFHFSQDTEFK